MSGLFPLPIITERLVISKARVNNDTICKYLHAVRSSLTELKPWVIWAHGIFNNESAENYLFSCERNWIYKTNNDIGLVLWIENINGDFIGNIIIWNINWQIPKFELGYWGNQLHSRNGYISEAVNATTRYLIKQLNAARIEIRTEKDNIRSSKVAKRIGFEYEGCLKNATRNVQNGELADVEIFGCISVKQLLPLNVKW